MLNNYSNQSLSDTTGLVTSVSLAGFDGDLFGIIGGNEQLCIAMTPFFVGRAKLVCVKYSRGKLFYFYLTKIFFIKKM